MVTIALTPQQSAVILRDILPRVFPGVHFSITTSVHMVHVGWDGSISAARILDVLNRQILGPQLRISFHSTAVVAA